MMGLRPKPILVIVAIAVAAYWLGGFVHNPMKSGNIDNQDSLGTYIAAGELHSGQTTSYRTGDDADNDGSSKSYTDNGDGTVTDNHTNLMWQKDDQAWKTWNNAIDYCRYLRLCNDNTWQGSESGEGDCSSYGSTKYSDWRLPTVIEGVTMLDYSCDSGSLTHCYGGFQNNALIWDSAGDTGTFWLSTTLIQFFRFKETKEDRTYLTNGAFLIGTDYGRVDVTDKANSPFVRCVRGQ